MSSTDKLNMTLDDVISQDKKKKQVGRGGKKVMRGSNQQRRNNRPPQGNQMRNRNRGGGAQRNQGMAQRKKQVAPVRANRPFNKQSGGGSGGIKRPKQLRQSNYRRQKIQQRPRPVSQQAQQAPSNDNSKKTILRITGLNFNIVNQEIYDLFTKIGPLSKCRIDFDEMGRSKGSAIVQYEKPEHARKAIEEYNGADLDQKTLNVEFLKPSDNVGRVMPLVQRKRISKPRNDNFRRNQGGNQRRGSGGAPNRNRNQGGNRMRTFRR